MAKYKAYPEYKTTGLGWLTEIPDHWEVKKLKYLGQAIIGLTYSPDDVVDEGEGTLVLRSSNVQNGKLEFLDNVYVRKSILLHLKVKEDDILICARNGSRALIGKNAKITKDAEGMTFGAFMSIFRSRYNNYLSHVFASALFEYQSGSFLTATINQLTTSNLNSFEIPLPPRTEQDRIVSFLDHETAKIDNLIEKQQQLIELLKEKCQAVISNVVNIRSNERKTKLKNLVNIQTGYPFPSAKFKFSPDNSIALLRGVNVGVDSIKWDDVVYWDVSALERLNEYLLVAGDIVFGMDRPWISSGARVSEIKEQDLPCLLLQRVARIRSNIKSYQPFIKLCLSSNEFREYAEIDLTGVSVPHISPEQISNFYVRDIPFDDQVYLAKKALEKIDKIQITQEMVEQTIQILQERRTALISAAVTGKIDVRDWVAPETQDVEEPQEATA